MMLDQKDPMLKVSSQQFDFDVGYTLPNGDHLDASDLFDILKTNMIANKVMGLSAIQMGIMSRVFVMGNYDDPSSVMEVLNPKITDFSDNISIMEESCASYPGLFVKIKRPTTIRARYTKVDGEVRTDSFGGLTARVFQHQYDLLDGLNFRDLANKYHLEQAEKKRATLIRRMKRGHALA